MSFLRALFPKRTTSITRNSDQSLSGGELLSNGDFLVLQKSHSKGDVNLKERSYITKVYSLNYIQHLHNRKDLKLEKSHDKNLK